MSNISLGDALPLIVALRRQQTIATLMNSSSAMSKPDYFSPGDDGRSLSSFLQDSFKQTTSLLNDLLMDHLITTWISDLIARLTPEGETADEHAHHTALPDSVRGPRGLPLDRIEVSSPFGWRWGRHHDGIDLRMPMLAPIYAVQGGTVTFAGWKGGYGKCIEITTESGQVHRYAHCNDIGVLPRKKVAAGKPIARVGSTGHSTGPHLHFEVLANGVPIDPWPLLRKA